MTQWWRLVAIGGAAGVAYAWVGALANRNPYYEPGAPAAPLGTAWGWRPSPVWLSSHALCVVPRNGYGIEWTRSGYLFRSDADRLKYTAASMALGGVGGAMAGAGFAAARSRRRRSP